MILSYIRRFSNLVTPPLLLRCSISRKVHIGSRVKVVANFTRVARARVWKQKNKNKKQHTFEFSLRFFGCKLVSFNDFTRMQPHDKEVFSFFEKLSSEDENHICRITHLFDNRHLLSEKQDGSRIYALLLLGIEMP